MAGRRRYEPHPSAQTERPMSKAANKDQQPSNGEAPNRDQTVDGKRPLTEADKLDIFRIATGSLVHRFGDKIKAGMSDDELAAALDVPLGIFGGSGDPDQPSVAFTGSGLRIWGGWHVVNNQTEKPLFAGKRTIAMAREVYGIADPNNNQLDLF